MPQFTPKNLRKGFKNKKPTPTAAKINKKLKIAIPKINSLKLLRKYNVSITEIKTDMPRPFLLFPIGDLIKIEKNKTNIKTPNTKSTNTGSL